MARAPDKRIEQAKEMYLQGQKLVEIASQLNLPEGTVRRWKCTHKWDSERSGKKSERSHRKKGGQPGNKNAVGNDGGAPEQNKTLKSMDSSASIFLMRPGDFFLPLSRLIRWICSGIRSRLPMLPLSEHRELPMCEINRTKRLKG